MCRIEVNNMSESEVQLGRKGRRLWGKFYSRKYSNRLSSDGERGSFPASSASNYGCPVATKAGALENKRSKAADERLTKISGEGSLNIVVESSPFQRNPYCAEGNRIRNHSGDTSLRSELDAFHSSGSNARQRAELFDCVISEGELPSESEACATLCGKHEQWIEHAGDTGNVADPSDRKGAREDSRKNYHRERTMTGSIATLCSENILQDIKLGDVPNNVAAPLDQVAVRDDIVEHSHQESVAAGSIATLCSENKPQQVEIVGHVANVNVAAPSDHITVKDAAAEYNDEYRMIAGSLVTFYGENSLQQIDPRCDTANVVASSELEDYKINVLAASDHIAARDAAASDTYEERIVNKSFATLCSENKKTVGLGDDIANAVSQLDHNAVRGDNAGYQDEERMTAESIATLYTENKQQVELGGDSMNIITTLDLILVRNAATECKHQERNLEEEANLSKIPHMRRLVEKRGSLTIIDYLPSKDQSNCVAETELDASVSDSVQCKVNGSPSVTMGLIDKCIVQDQAIRQENAIQVEAIPLKSKPDKMQCQSTKLDTTSNACGLYSESSCLTTAQSTAQLKCSKANDNFSLQLPDNCHLNSCQLTDHDNQTKRTGPILRSSKIHLATSVVKKHQRRMMASMSSEGGRSRNTFIRKRLKKNAVKGLLEDYLKDWMDKNVRTGTFENEHCLPFLVHAPKRVECYQCKTLVMRGKEVTCAVLNCRRPYHLTCAKQLQRCHWFKKREFKCPQHVCMVCNSRHRLWRCVRCSVAVHKDCAPWPEAMVFFRDRSRTAICWRHHEDWRLEHKRKGRTNDIKEAFLRLPVPYFIEDFKIEAHFWKDVMENGKEPPPYVQIRRNVFLTKKKRDDTDDGVGCSCGKEAVVCGENCECRVQSMSCSKACHCSELCTNKPFRKEKRIKIVKTMSCGWGAEAAEVIKKGEFVIEYVGEVIDDALCEARLWEMKHRGVHNFYMCEIGKDFTIDATFKGNPSRFLNHSCDPNCKLEKWRVDGDTRVGIFAAKDIRVGAPLTYDYRFIQFGPNVKCHCGAANCQGDLGEPFGTNGTKTGGNRAVNIEHLGSANGVSPNLHVLQWGSKRKRS